MVRASLGLSFPLFLLWLVWYRPRIAPVFLLRSLFQDQPDWEVWVQHIFNGSKKNHFLNDLGPLMTWTLWTWLYILLLPITEKAEVSDNGNFILWLCRISCVGSCILPDSLLNEWCLLQKHAPDHHVCHVCPPCLSRMPIMSVTYARHVCPIPPIMLVTSPPSRLTHMAIILSRMPVMSVTLCPSYLSRMPTMSATSCPSCLSRPSRHVCHTCYSFVLPHIPVIITPRYLLFASLLVTFLRAS